MATPGANQTLCNTFPIAEALVSPGINGTYSRFPMGGDSTLAAGDTKSTTGLTIVNTKLRVEAGWTLYWTGGSNSGQSRPLVSAAISGSDTVVSWSTPLASTPITGNTYYFQRSALKVAYPFDRTRVFPTRKTEFESSRDQRRALWSQSKRLYTVRTNPMTPLESAALWRFFIKCQGPLKAFWFLDPVDDVYLMARFVEDSLRLPEVFPVRYSQGEIALQEVFGLYAPGAQSAQSFPTSGGNAKVATSGLNSTTSLVDATTSGETLGTTTRVAPGWTIYFKKLNGGTPATDNTFRIVSALDRSNKKVSWQIPLSVTPILNDEFLIVNEEVQLP